MLSNSDVRPEYAYSNAEPTYANAYLWPAIKQEIEALPLSAPARVFDLGCGSGATSGMLNKLGFDATGVDPSESGIRHAKSAYPTCRFELGSSSDPLAETFGQFPLVVSLEVIEHVYDPRRFAQAVYQLTAPGGTALISTPYHGYLKNVALAVSGKMDRHFTALWEGGHIKFFSIPTLTTLLTEAGFQNLRYRRVGRIPALAKSMIAIAARPSQP
jgi:2-polyprenyl-3-methyl-5-hydroxy-6-metoxy-1,4-benzoquinol methylase